VSAWRHGGCSAPTHARRDGDNHRARLAGVGGDRRGCTGAREFAATKSACEVNGCPDKFDARLTGRCARAIAETTVRCGREATAYEFLSVHPDLRAEASSVSPVKLGAMSLERSTSAHMIVAPDRRRHGRLPICDQGGTGVGCLLPRSGARRMGSRFSGRSELAGRRCAVLVRREARAPCRHRWAKRSCRPLDRRQRGRNTTGRPAARTLRAKPVRRNRRRRPYRPRR
jgi:hypothetical protein